MKTIRKLLPFATIASVTALVVPTIASCSKTVVSTSDFNYNPAQHDQTEISVSPTNLTSYNEILKDYCANNGLHFLEDCTYDVAKIIKAEKEEIESDPSIKDLKYDFSLSFSNVRLEESKQKISPDHPNLEIPGYKISFTYTLDVALSYTNTSTQDGSTIENKPIINDRIVYYFNNYFLCLAHPESSNSTSFAAYLTTKNVNYDDYSTRYEEYWDRSGTETIKSGDKILSTDNYTDSWTYIAETNKDKGEGWESAAPSHYLEKVKVNWSL